MALGVSARVVVPETAPRIKREGISSFGAEVVRHGETYDEAEKLAQGDERHLKAVLVSYAEQASRQGDFKRSLETLERLQGYAKQTRIPAGIAIREAVKEWMSDEGRGTMILERIGERRGQVESGEREDDDQLTGIELGLLA